MAFSSIRRFFTRPNPTLFPEEFAKDAKAKAAQSQAFVGRLMAVREWIVGFGEAVVLCVFFRVAAGQTHSFELWALVFLMSCAVGLYVAVPIGKTMGGAYLVKTKWLRGLLVIASLAAFFAIAATNAIGNELSRVVDQIAKSTAR